MNKEEVVEKVNGFLVEEFEIDPVVLKPEAVLKEALDLDSLDYVDLVVVIEDNFGFKVTGEDFVGITTLDDFYNLICNKAVAV
ncbi:acyl carrier protein [Reichenbachiella faecimaris]|uniref:Acyl carrier protein n=1 Tax=Reichenbachiella faecimaris TaxID=692418 RepID=A0A1W2G690_REIFA|nr:phosphopantetheine-binding protein [Reichenbachiella faecimaris]SMD32185.1 acyl carrier protein [Reichenbachiella faecimaris]